MRRAFLAARAGSRRGRPPPPLPPRGGAGLPFSREVIRGCMPPSLRPGLLLPLPRPSAAVASASVASSSLCCVSRGRKRGGGLELEALRGRERKEAEAEAVVDVGGREREREEGGAQVDDRASERIKHSFLCERELGRNTGREDDEGTTERRERKSAKRRGEGFLESPLFLRRRCCLFSKEFHRVALRKLQWLFPSNTVVMGTVFGTTVPCARCKVSLPPFMSSMTRMSLLSCVPLPHALEQQQRHIKRTSLSLVLHTQSFFTLIRDEQIKVYTCRRQCSVKNPSAIRKIPHIHWAELPLIVVALSSSVLNGLEKQFHTLETEEEELKLPRVHVSLSLSLSVYVCL